MVQGISTAPGLQLSQLQKPTSLIAVNDSPITSPPPAEATSVSAETSSTESITTVSTSAYPCLATDLSVREFLVAFGIYGDVICSLHPNRKVDLDSYLELIGDLNLRCGRNILSLSQSFLQQCRSLHFSITHSSKLFSLEHRNSHHARWGIISSFLLNL